MKCPHCGATTADEARFCGTCGRATSSTEPSRAGGAAPGGPAPDLAGREIAGRYRILAKLGEGGMGAVYRGEQISLKRRCAIKLLKPELSGDAGLVKRFNAEAELVAKLSHPNVVGIYDFGQDRDGTLFIAMEYLEGRTLREALIADGPMPPRRAIAIASQIAASLTDAHAHGIVHRDLKPDNVMLTERGRDKDVVRVLDFGIAKLRDEGKNTVQQMTQAGDLVGTPQYMAPEQIRGDRVDGRTDVYALGAMLYEMVTGRLPFEGPTVMAILSKHLTETPPPPSVRRPDLQIPPPIDALVMASLAKDPELRVASMEVVGEQLAAIGSLLGSPSQPFVVPAAPAAGSWRPGMPTQQTGALAAPTPTPHGAYPALPVPAMTPPPMHAPPVAARTRRTGLWLALGAVAVAGIAIGAVVATRSSGGGSGGSSSAGDPADDPWTKPRSHGGDPAPSDPGGDVALDGTTYRDPGGWTMIAPPGYAGPTTTQMNGVPVTTWATQLGGTGALVTVITTQTVPMTDDQLLASASSLAMAMQGMVVDSGFETIHGARRLHAVYDLQAGRAEAVLYDRPGDQRTSSCSPRRFSAFDASASACAASRFERRVSPP